MLRGLLAVALASLLAACSPDSSPEAAPPAAAGDLLLVTVDTLRADRVGLLGAARPTTPRIDALFAGGRIYERAYSATSNTPPSVVTILSGLLPEAHRVRFFYQRVPESVPLVPERLPAGFQTAAFVSNMVLTDEALGIASRFDHYDDFVDELESTPERAVYERGAARTTDAVLAWLAGERDPERRLFLWVHYIDPHGPYRPPESVRGHFDHPQPHPIDLRRMLRYQRQPGVDDGLWYVDRYDEEVLQTDAEVGRLLDGYARLGGDLDGALVVFTADHGETMMEHERYFSHGKYLYESVVRVPLLVRGPGVVPGRSALPAHGTDVAPTLLRAAGATPDPSLPDVDLRSGAGLEADRVVQLEVTQRAYQRRAIVRGDRKWEVRVAGPERRIQWLRAFDLAQDPGETAPRTAAIDEPGVQPLLEAVRSDPDPAGVSPELQTGTKISEPKLAREVPEATRRALEALGYVDAGPTADEDEP